MTKVKASSFVEYVRSKVGNAYLWGGQGERLYDILAWYADTKNQKESGTVSMLGFMEDKGYPDIQFFDCSGLGVSFLLEKGAISCDMTADGIYRKCTKISEKESRPSDMVFLLNSNGKATHIGYIVENGIVVHALNQSVGVIEEPVSKRKWVYGRPDFCMEYDLETEMEYFPTYTGTSSSIIDALNSVGADSSYNYRKKIASVNHIDGYKGTTGQNRQMLLWLSNGILIKP